MLSVGEWQEEEFPSSAEVHKDVFGSSEHTAAAGTLIVSGFGDDNVLIEVEADAGCDRELAP